MKKKINRNYLEINSLQDLNEVNKPSDDYSVIFLEPVNFQLNKFFYKNVGKKHQWVDRLVWTEQQWIDYVSNKKIKTYLLKNQEDLVGYFELIYLEDKNEGEIAYMGILEEYFGKKLGGFLLSEAIKKSFFLGVQRVWLHTCSLDHKNALKNYLSRGMTIFKSETLKQHSH